MFMEGGCPGASDWQWVPGSRGFVGRNLTHSCCTTAGGECAAAPPAPRGVGVGLWHRGHVLKHDLSSFPWVPNHGHLSRSPHLHPWNRVRYRHLCAASCQRHNPVSRVDD